MGTSKRGENIESRRGYISRCGRDVLIVTKKNDVVIAKSKWLWCQHGGVNKERMFISQNGKTDEWLSNRWRERREICERKEKKAKPILLIVHHELCSVGSCNALTLVGIV